MSDELAPALTAQEWLLSASGDNLREIAKARPDNVVAGIALANAALPDDSLYKITQADVRWLRNIAAQTGWFQAEQLAAKLAALLPPELPTARL